MYTCIDKSMQIVLEQGSIDNPLNFNIGRYNSFFILVCLPNTYACKGVFNPNIPIFLPDSAEGLHFSAFHFLCKRSHLNGFEHCKMVYMWESPSFKQ